MAEKFIRERYPERFPYLWRRKKKNFSFFFAPGSRIGILSLPPSFRRGNNDNFVMRTNLGNCGIVGNSGGGAALKGDHLDIEERREKRKVMVGIYIYIYIYTYTYRLLSEIERTDLDWACSLYVSRFLDRFFRDVHRKQDLGKRFHSRTSLCHFEKRSIDKTSARRM